MLLTPQPGLVEWKPFLRSFDYFRVIGITLLKKTRPFFQHDSRKLKI
jgi:hypothetical protein